MTVEEDGDLVVAGVVGKPFGVRGEVYVFADPDIAEDFLPGARFQTGAVAVVVASSRVHRSRRLVRFEGVEDRDGAEALRGTILRVPRAAAVLPADALWTADLLGRDIVDDDGAPVGVVEDALDGLAHGFLVVARPDGAEVLIPADADLVDVDADPIVLHSIPGLLDDGEV